MSKKLPIARQMPHLGACISKKITYRPGDAPAEDVEGLPVLRSLSKGESWRAHREVNGDWEVADVLAATLVACDDHKTGSLRRPQM